jgi:hypothetical protein
MGFSFLKYFSFPAELHGFPVVVEFRAAVEAGDVGGLVTRRGLRKSDISVGAKHRHATS